MTKVSAWLSLARAWGLPALFGLAALLGAVSAHPAGAAADVIRVGGTGSAMGTMEAVGAAFAATTGHRVEVAPSLGSSGGVKALRAGALDVAALSRPPSPAEAEEFVAVEYARTPFVFAVAGGAVERITLQQLVDLYSGKTTRWPGGDPVRIVLRPEIDSDNAVIRAMSPALSQALDAALARRGMVMAFNDQEAADAIASMPGGIGPTTLALIQAERRPLRPLVLNGVAPTVEAIADGRYPYVKSFHLLVRRETSEPVARFVAFLRSPPARALLEALGQRQIAD